MDERYPPLDEETEALAAAYSLGALAPDEAAAFELQLTLPAVRAEVTACRMAVEGLDIAAPLRLPPPALRARVLEGAQPPAPARVLGFTWPRVAPWLAAAAMLLVSLGLGVRLTQQQAIINQQAALGHPSMVMMEAGELAPHAHGRFYLAPDSQQAVLVVAELPPLTQDRVYQLWLVDANGVRDNGGTFRVDEGGYGTLLVQAPRPLGEYARIGVTTEPRGGSPGPTSGRIIGASLADLRPVDS